VGIKISREKTRPEKGRSLKSYLTSWLDASKQETLEKLFPPLLLLCLSYHFSKVMAEMVNYPHPEPLSQKRRGEWDTCHE
jgi:hypothetical protein